MADIKIIVQYETVTRAKKATQELANVTVSLDKAQKGSSTTASKLAKETNNLNKTVNKNTQALLRYKSSVDPVFASEQKLLNMKKLLKAEVASGTMTWRQAGKEMLNYRRNLSALNSRLGMTKNRMNANGMAVQQLGYQVGDFAVQVQSGTSPFVAFSQQATQLTGVLGMLNPKLIGLGAVLGIAIPVGTALVRMLVEMGKTAEEASKDVEELNEALTKLESATFDKSLAGVESIEEKWSSTLGLVREYYEILADEKKTALFDTTGFDKNIKTLFGQIQALQRQKKNQGNLLDVSGTQELKDFTEDYNKLVRTKEILLGLDTSSKTALAESYDVIVKTLSAEGLMTKDLSKKLGLFAEQSNIIGVVNNQIKDQAEVEAKAQIATERYYKNRFKDEEALMSMSLSMSKENIELTKRNSDLEIRRHNQRFSGEESVMSMALSLSKENIKLTKDNSDLDIRRHNQRFEGEESLMSQAVSMSNETIALVKKVAGARKKAYDERVANETFFYKTRFADEESLMSMSLTPSKQDFSFYDKQEEAQKEFLATLRLSTQEQLMTAGLKDRELLVAEQFNETYKTQLELDKLGIEYGSARYERALETLKTQQDSILYVYDMVEAEKKLTEEKEKQGQLIDTIGGIIGDGFISMVEGTESVKDAFKSMARAIIKELYQILVVQQMVNAAKAAMGIPVPNANGNVFSSGSIQAYADGGVVGSPTTFPMSGGRTGLMGEAGPEAIMPLKRGANGKLGVQMEGGGATTVVQNFNFSANGDDSVKRIIAQAAPKIAQMTKSEMINDRRRGGTMKATFG